MRIFCITSSTRGTFQIEQWLNLARNSATEITKDEEISKILTDLSKASLNGKLPVWYGVTDIVNPTRKYYELKHPEIQDDPTTLQRFREGIEIQDMASQWFLGIDERVVREVEVNGKTVGITGLKGRMDFLLADNIVEFKTTHHGIFETADAIEKNPQDLEQLCTYALLSSRTSGKHYLVYFSEDFEKSFRAFEIQIRDQEKLKILIKDRLDLLRKSIEKDVTSQLVRCRYFGFGCKFQINNTCECNHLEPFDSAFLRDNVSMKRNLELEEALYKQKELISSERVQNFSLWDLLTPRKAYLRHMKLLSEENEDVDRENVEIMKRAGVAILNSGSYVERRELRLRRFLLGSTIMLSLRSDIGDDSSATRLYPSATRVYQNPSANLNANSISPYYLVRLAMICSLAGSDTGYLVVAFRAEREKVDCYRVRFSRLGEFKAQIERMLRELSYALEKKDSNVLPLCPSFLVGNCGINCLCK